VIRVSDYPLGDAAAVSFELDVATAEETASETATATNPAFDGTIPSLGYLRVSASEPGVGDSVTVEPGPKPQSAASFGSLQSAQAHAPNGTAINTTVTDGEVQFNTVAEGSHRVDYTITNAGGREFSETTTVVAGPDTTDRPPTLRAQTGALGTYAVATDGLSEAQIETSQAGTRVQADAVIPANSDPPNRLHVHTAGVDAAPTSTTQVRVLRGETREQIRERSTVVLHPPRLTEDALIFVNGEPAVQGEGETELVRVSQANGSWSITAPTRSDGTLSVETVNDPGFIEATIFSVRTSIPDLPIIGWALVPSPGIAAFAVVLVGRRRRDIGGQRGGGAT
jgi:hypothetical protein